MNSRTSKLLWGAGLGYLNFGFQVLVGLWLTRFLLGRIGTEAMGLWVQLLQVVGFLGLLDLGVLTLLPRDVAAATGRAGGWTGAADLPAITGRIARLTLWQTPLVGLVALAGWLVMTTAEPAAAGPLAAVLTGYTLLFPLRLAGAVLAGLQDSRFIGLAQLAGFVAGTGTTVGLAAAGFGLLAPAGGWVAGQAVIAVLAWSRVLGRFRPVLPAALPTVPWPVARGLLVAGLWASLSALGNMLVGGVDALAIGRFHPATAVLQYVFTAKLVVVLSSQALALTVAVLPGLTEVRAAGDHARTVRVLAAYSQTAMLMSGWIGCLVLMTNSGFVGWWVGPEYDLGLGVAGLLVAGMLLRHWGGCQAVAMFAAHRERVLWATSLCEGLAAAAAIVTLASVGPRWVPLGALAGTGLVLLPVTLTVLTRGGVFPVRAQLRGLGWWAGRMAVAVGLILAVRSVWTPLGLPQVIAAGVAVTAGYAGLMLPAALRGEVGDYLRPRLTALRTLGGLRS
jgi:O-antigen/teichoic acid export membrane protein